MRTKQELIEKLVALLSFEEMAMLAEWSWYDYNQALDVKVRTGHFPPPTYNEAELYSSGERISATKAYNDRTKLGLPISRRVMEKNNGKR